MKRAKHSLSHYKLFSCDMGNLIPCGLTEVLPGDSIQQATSALVRMAPLLSPVMHPVHARIHHWYVPHRLVWDEWEDFITGGPDGMDQSVFPTITFNNPAVGSLPDYLGVPPEIDGLSVSALPFRGYALIFNEWYRDQDLKTPLPISTDSGNDTTTNTQLQRVAWEKDYFTSSRPWEQKGPSITLPLGDKAPVVPIPGQQTMAYQTSNGALAPASAMEVRTGGGLGAGATPINLGGGMAADLTGVSALTINALREAFALQRFEEARARYGSRYTEYLRYLGVRSSDARLQRPEYLGGGKQTIQFSEVVQTAEG